MSVTVITAITRAYYWTRTCFPLSAWKCRKVRSPVLTTVASLTGLIALAVTVSTSPLQSAQARFPADVSAPLVEDEPRDGFKPQTREDPGSAVTVFLRDRHLYNSDRVVSMCQSLLQASQHEEVSGVLRTLPSAVGSYTAWRRHLNPQGEWFPKREVAVEGYDEVLSVRYTST